MTMVTLHTFKARSWKLIISALGTGMLTINSQRVAADLLEKRPTISYRVSGNANVQRGIADNKTSRSVERRFTR
ncbi:hypothetical protein EDB87DRAFT_1648712 [Lactarius vividus]|nr:hypothetical protein EDB87DRAFT_1648712 [Lactarius vividus]